MIRFPSRNTAVAFLIGFLLMPFQGFAQDTILPPRLEFIGDRSVEVAQTLGINVHAYSQNQEVPWLWVDSLPRGADFFDRGEGFRTFLWHPGADQVGQHIVKFIAADAKDQAIRTEREVVITVKPGSFESQAFSIIAPNDVDAFVGNQLAVVITATDSNGTVPSLTASGMPEGATLDDNGDGSRSFNWLPTSAQFGSHTIRLNAVSANFPNISTSHDMQVNVISRAPQISFPVSPGVEAGDVLSFSVNVTKPSGAVPSLTIDPLPQQASFTDNGDGSRQFTWQTSNADIGTHSFLLTAIDPLTSLSSTIDLYINVLPDASGVVAGQTIRLSSDLLSLELLAGAAPIETFDVSTGSISASAGFLSNEAELLVNGETAYVVELLPGINTVALESVASDQRTVLTIDRIGYPTLVPNQIPPTFAVDVDDKNIALSANVSPDERSALNSVDIYSLSTSSLTLEDYVGFDTDFEHATSIDISGETLVAASRDAPQAGVWVYGMTEGRWQFEQHLAPDFEDFPEGFGSVAVLDGDTLAVSAVYDAGSSLIDPAARNAPGAGAVLIYQRLGDEWRYQTILKAPVPEFNDYFGSSLALEGDTLVVGAIGEDSSGTGNDSDPMDNEYRYGESADFSAGAVFVFEREGDEWSQSAYLKPGDNVMPGLAFGFKVAVFEDTIAVSALSANRTSEAALAIANPSFYGAGAVYLFDRVGSEWLQSEKFEPPANNWRYGLDIDLKKNQLLLLTQARAYFYEKHNSEWLLLWDENVGRNVVSFNHEVMVFGVFNSDTLIYSSEGLQQQ